MYAKLFSRITESSLIEESITTRWVFVAMLAISEPDGTVIGTDIAIARRINVPLKDFEESMKVLMSEDRDSNNQDHEGARIIPSVGERGYFLTGYQRYRGLKTEDDRRAYMAQYMAKKRASVNNVNNDVNSVNIQLAQLTHAEADTNTEEKHTKRGFVKPTPLEVSEYAKSIGFPLDGQYFIDYQDARAWKLKGGQPIKDWKAVVRTWKRNDKKHAQNSNAVNPPSIRDLQNI